MVGFGGLGMMSAPGMFPGGFVGASQGFVGARPGGPAALDYYEQEQERQRQQLALSLQQRAMKQQSQQTDRELSLKELLANHQMGQDQAATGLARDRLGLDANVASADANQRANQLSLSERLGWAGENRMANSDAAQNALAMKKFESDQSNTDRSFTQLSAAQQADRALALKELDQRNELARLPYNGMTQADAAQMKLGEKRLGQEGELARLPYEKQTMSDRWRNSLAEKQQTLDQSNTDRAFNAVPASDQAKMSLTERLAGREDTLRRDMQAEALRADFDKWNGLSAAEKQQNKQFGASLKQRLSEFQQGQKNWQTERDEPSMMQFQDLGFKQQGLDLQRQGQQDEAAYRKEHGVIQREGNQMHLLAPYMEALLSGDPEARDAAAAAVRKLLPNVPTVASNPAERATLNMARAGVIKAQGGSAATTPREQSTQNQSGAEALGQMVLRGELTPQQAEKMAQEGDRQTVQGARTMLESLREYVKEQQAIETRSRQGNFFSPEYVPSRLRGVGK